MYTFSNHPFLLMCSREIIICNVFTQNFCDLVYALFFLETVNGVCNKFDDINVLKKCVFSCTSGKVISALLW